MYKIVSTCFGIGYIKGGGTLASILCCICLYFVPNELISTWISFFIAAILLGVGMITANKVEAVWGKDNYRVVIDEILGMYITMMLVPISIKSLIIGLVLFRFFDILKPLYIRRAEKLPGGLGVMTDDVLAGIYANLLLQVAIFVNLL